MDGALRPFAEGVEKPIFAGLFHRVSSPDTKILA